MKLKLLTLAALPLLGAASANAALLVHYDFNNSDATNSGTGGNGTESGGVAYVPSTAGSIAGNAWSGNRTGANDAYINTGLSGDALGFGATGTYTAMAWINWAGTSGNGDHMVFGQDDGAGNNAQLHHGVRDDSAPLNIHFGGWGGAQDMSDAGAIPNGGGLTGDDNWVHVAWQYDGANKNVFVGGALVSTSPGNNITDPTLNIIIGGHGRDSNLDPAPGNSFNGLLDEVRIYDSALSAAEITTAMNAVNAIPEPTSLGLLGLASLGLLRRRR